MPYLGRALSEDVFHYKKYWTKDAMKKRKKKKENKMYDNQEINDVIEDVEGVLTKIEYRIGLIEDNIQLARNNIKDTSALSYLSNAQEQVDKIDFVPIIDTLEGMIPERITGNKNG